MSYIYKLNKMYHSCQFKYPYGPYASIIQCTPETLKVYKLPILS